MSRDPGLAVQAYAPCGAKAVAVQESKADVFAVLRFPRFKRAQQVFRLVLIIAGSLILARPADGARSSAPSLFPQFSGQTLTGKPFHSVEAAANKPAVLVFSFSRKAARDARSWDEHVSKDFPNGIEAYGIIMLESAPKPFRGMAVSGIRSSMPPSMQDRTIVSYRGEKLWKQRLGVTNESRAYVLLLGPGGHIEWMNASAFTDTEYAHLRNCISDLLQSNR